MAPSVSANKPTIFAAPYEIATVKIEVDLPHNET